MQEKRIPLRKCLGCGEMIGKKGAVRIVRSKEGEISLDLTGKKAGRGAYICHDAECFAMVRKAHRLEKALKCAVPDEIYDIIEKELSSDQ
ncbi:MAG: YlxR family protein [Oscillospiraceae bacterium]|nr:YlxR family protein [Oscillospiraceae bacterium]